MASFKTALVVAGLPKTRSAKILRGTMRKIAEGEDYPLPDRRSSGTGGNRQGSGDTRLRQAVDRTQLRRDNRSISVPWSDVALGCAWREARRRNGRLNVGARAR